MSLGSCDSRPQPEIQRELDNLSQAVSNLRSAGVLLNERLVTVLDARPKPEGGIEKLCGEPEVNSEVGNRIHAEVVEIRAIERIIRATIEDLAV